MFVHLLDKLRSRVAAGAVMAVLAGLGLPTVISEFHMVLVTDILVFAVFAVAFNLSFGFTNLPSFGHAAFFGLGAYGVAITLTFTPEMILLPVLVGLLAAVVYGAVIGAISTQGTGIYFALLTFAFAQGLYEIAIRTPGLSGGSGGLFVEVPTLPGGVALSDRLTAYYLALAVLALTLLLSHRLLRSPFGQVMQAVKHNQDRAEAIGYPVRQIKVVVFTLSGVLSAIAGVLFVINSSFVSPNVFFFHTSLDVLIMAILGGTGTLWGPMLGAAFIILLEEAVSGLSNVGTLITGLLFILVIVFFPDGIGGIFE